MIGQRTEPSLHYDRVTQAWSYLLGENLHYGYFAEPSDSLAEATELLTRHMARAAELTADCVVLDVGCGIGQPARLLAREFGCRVLGISTSRVGIEMAHHATAAAGLADRVRFEVRNGMQMRLDDASIDRVWVMESSHLMPDRGALVHECARVLRPGGRWILCDIVLRQNLPLQAVLRHAREIRLLDQVFGRARMETLATYRMLAAENGLLVDIEEDLTAETLPTFSRWRSNAERYQAEVERLIGVESLEQFVQSCDVLERFWQQGILGYGMISAVRPAAT